MVYESLDVRTIMKTISYHFAAQAQSASAKSGFALRDLVAVVATVGFLALVLMPALARDLNRDLRAVCLNHMAQLGRALTLYAADSRDWLPPNYDDANTVPYHDWVGGAGGGGDPQEFNPDILKDPTRAMLTPYLDGDISVYRCPADPRVGLYQGTNVALQGTVVPSARSVSLNGAVGTYPYGGGKSPVDGSWLDGNHAHTANKTWHCYGKITDFSAPGPSQLVTFLEEDPYSINDGTFAAVGPSDSQLYKLIDWPSTQHDMAGALSFGDGHAEIHTWQDRRTQVVNGFVSQAIQPGNVDIRWLSTHISARISP